jgi:inosine-uridine nucleoside N-ribohydrolase
VDFNVQVDVQSANLVFEKSDPTLVPLTVTVETSLRRAYLTRLQQSGPLGQLIARQAEAFAEDLKYEALFGQTCEGLPADTINLQHDPLTCAIALSWDQGVVIEEVPVSSTIVEGWMQQRIMLGGKMTRVVSAVDGSAFSEFWVKVVTSRESKEQRARI